VEAERRAEAKKRLEQELVEMKEQTAAENKKKAEELEKLKAGNGMMLATPGDATALEEARRINAENARLQEEGYKAKAGSSKVTPMLKPAVNLANQVWENERLQKTGHRGKNGDPAVSS
jgi:hypothetical protein